MRLYYNKQGKPQLARTPKYGHGPSLNFARPRVEGNVRFVIIAKGRTNAQVFHSGEWKDCHSEYVTYKQARNRCGNNKHKAWKYYGGRGICFRFTSFQQFINHIGLKPTSNHSLDRIENDGHYEVGNVRWATAKEQAQNKRPRNLLTSCSSKPPELSPASLL